MPLEIYKRGDIWHCRGTVGPNGRRKHIRKTLRTTDKDTAARQAAEIESAYWKGTFDGPGAILRFETACDLFLAGGGSPRFLFEIDKKTGRIKTDKKTGKQIETPLKKRLNKTLVKDIRPGMVKTLANELFGHCKGQSKNRLAITPVTSVVNYCADELELCAHLRIKRFEPEDVQEKDPVSLPWIRGFQAAAKPHLSALPMFMFLTGARPSEALNIWRDRDLNLPKGTAIIQQTKVSAERKAHLPALMVATLANLYPVPHRPVFVYGVYQSMLDAWLAVVERADLPRLTPHCCRHGFATELLRRGIDVITVAWLGGWASPEQVLRTYGHAIKKRSLTDRLLDSELGGAFDDVTDHAAQVSGKLSIFTDADLRRELQRRAPLAQIEHNTDKDLRQAFEAVG